jgi:hypothetical protein
LKTWPEKRGSLRQLVAACALVLPAIAAAQWAGWDYEYDQEKKPWSEIVAQIPPYPKPENLIEFEADAGSPHRFYIDAASISVGEDGVVRYTLMIKSAGGATNVSFEGMRCELRQQKYYAVGRPDGAWVRTRNPQWRPIEYRQINRHHGVLYADVFCNGKLTVSSPQEAVRLLKSGKPRLHQ